METNILLNTSRIGNFTSSEIVGLTKNGKGAGTYCTSFFELVEECNMERRLGRSLTTEQNAKPLSWGKLCEKRAFDLLGMEYILSSNETHVHPTIPYWSGSKDGIKHDEGKTVIDIKCPITLKSFCQLVDGTKDPKSDLMLHSPLTIEAVRANHKDGDKYYWQLVSNSCINDCKYAELVVYVPYQYELDIIREMASNYDGDQNKMAWINWSQDIDLPYLIEGGHYKNLNIIRFEVPQADKDFLTERVKAAGKLLIEYASKEM
jgi:hypothetical protein